MKVGKIGYIRDSNNSKAFRCGRSERFFYECIYAVSMAIGICERPIQDDRMGWMVTTSTLLSEVLLEFACVVVFFLM